MPYLETAQEWLTQSTLLLQARPTTTRISTKYKIIPIPDPSTSPPKERKPKPASTTAPATTTEVTPAPPQEPIRAILSLKTYDEASHTSLKYSTTKAAEVSRLIQILGRLGRGMAGLPEKEDAVLGEEGGVATPALESAVPAAGKAGGQGGAGGKKGKKKGKK